MDPLAQDDRPRVGRLEPGLPGVGGRGGGWPATFEDVAAGIDALVPEASPQGLDLDQVVIVGTPPVAACRCGRGASAGLPDDAPGAGPEVERTSPCRWPGQQPGGRR